MASNAKYNMNQPLPMLRFHTVWLAAWAACAAILPARAFDVILDPKQVAQLLADISRFHHESETAPAKDGQLDALWEMGERVLDLTELMSQDLQGHGFSDPAMISLIERRLKENGVVVTNSKAGYHYDLAAFHEYLRRAPNGPRAVDARYVLIGFDEPGDDVAAIQRSIAAKQRFIHDYPKYQDISVAELLLAQQYNHLARVYSSLHKQTLADQQRKLAQDQYRRIVKLYPSSEEAETARDALSQ